MLRVTSVPHKTLKPDKAESTLVPSPSVLMLKSMDGLNVGSCHKFYPKIS